MMLLSNLQSSVSVVLKNALPILTPEFGVKLLAPVGTIYIFNLYFNFFSFLNLSKYITSHSYQSTEF